MGRHPRIFSTTALVVSVSAMVVALILLRSGDAALSRLPAGNLVKNPGGESPTGGEHRTDNISPSGWMKEDEDPPRLKAMQVVRYRSRPGEDHPDRAVSAAIGGGKNVFYGGYPSRISTVYQLIDVSAAAPEIDAGGVKACLAAHLGGGRTKGVASVELAFLGEDDAALGQFRIGPVTAGHRKNEVTLLRRAAESRIPADTRQLRVLIRAESGGSPSNFGSADNLFVALTKGRCEPALVVRCAGKSLVATVSPSDVARTTRVRFTVRGGKSKQATDARAPYVGRFTMAGLTGRLTVTAAVTQQGAGTLTLVKKSRRC